jgi:hypothetical protein
LAFPPTEEEVKLAKDQILNAEVFEYESRAGILGRRMTLDYYDYPSDFLEQLNAKIRSVTPAEVTAAWKKHLNPKNLKIVAVGNDKGFEKPLSTFGAVTTLDLSIPEPKAKAAAVSAGVSAEASAKGAKAVEALLAKSGGREGWKGLKSLKSEIEGKRNTPQMGEATIKGSETVVLPGKVRMELGIEAAMGSFDIIQVFSPTGAWMKVPSPSGETMVMDMPGDRAKQMAASRRVEYTVVLHRLAAGEYRATADGGKLAILDAEGDEAVATLTLDADGRIAKIEYKNAAGEDATRTYTNYKETGGLFFPFAATMNDGQNEGETKVLKIEVNPKVEDSIFDKPK